MAKAKNHWKDRSPKEPEANKEPETKTFYYVYKGLPIRAVYYVQGEKLLPKGAHIPEYKDGQWNWHVENDLINIATNDLFKEYEVKNLRTFKRKLEDYMRSSEPKSKLSLTLDSFA